jgi:hypothetical protein
MCLSVERRLQSTGRSEWSDKGFFHSSARAGQTERRVGNGQHLLVPVVSHSLPRTVEQQTALKMAEEYGTGRIGMSNHRVDRVRVDETRFRCLIGRFSAVHFGRAEEKKKKTRNETILFVLSSAKLTS